MYLPAAQITEDQSPADALEETENAEELCQDIKHIILLMISTSLEWLQEDAL